MTKQEKKVSVKAYRTKDGKRVKPFSRRQKVLTGAAVGGSVLGLVAAVKNKKNIKNLINKARLKKGIPKEAVIPDKYTFDEKNLEFAGTANLNHARQNNRYEKGFEDLNEMLFYGSELDLHRGDGTGGFFQTINPKTNKIETFVTFSAKTGISDKYSGRDVDLIVNAKLPEGLDPRGIDVRAFQDKVKTDVKLRDAIQFTEEITGIRNVLGDPKVKAKLEESKNIIFEALKDIPSMGKVNTEMVDVRKVAEEKVKEFKRRKKA